ncbi:MAG: toprim domain-containing protein [Thiolinea sp.]
MRADQAKTIPIHEYLDSVEGIKPQKSRLQGKELWYHSPIREGDQSPSFKVDTELNLWFDHGANEGGKIIDLVCKVRNVTVREALAILDASGLHSYSSHSQQKSKDTHQEKPRLFNLEEMAPSKKISSANEKEKVVPSTYHQVLQVKPLQHPSLLQYLQDRGIEPNIAKHYLKQVTFKHPDKDRQYFALGWQNGEGYEVRNKYFKGFAGTGKTFSLLEGSGDDRNNWLIFEGFMDFLSYLTYLRQHKNIQQLNKTAVVLNSTALWKQVMDAIAEKQPETLYFFLDNDVPGRNTLKHFQDALTGQKMVDMGYLYEGYKDVNEWLCALSE